MHEPAPIDPQAELHIASLVVHATPSRTLRVAAHVAALPGAEVHATAPSGKLVVTLEAGTSGEILSLMTDIQGVDGVLSAALVYQYAGSLASMNEEVADADCETGLH